MWNRLIGLFCAAALGALTIFYVEQIQRPRQFPSQAIHWNHSTESSDYTASSAKASIQDTSAEIVAYYTKVLAWFTGVLAAISVVQGFILYRADKTAQKSADAALVGAKATQSSVRLTKRNCAERASCISRRRQCRVHMDAR